jgi:hypothetical protein
VGRRWDTAAIGVNAAWVVSSSNGGGARTVGANGVTTCEWTAQSQSRQKGAGGTGEESVTAADGALRAALSMGCVPLAASVSVANSSIAKTATSRRRMEWWTFGGMTGDYPRREAGPTDGESHGPVRFACALLKMTNTGGDWFPSEVAPAIPGTKSRSGME